MSEVPANSEGFVPPADQELVLDCVGGQHEVSDVDTAYLPGSDYVAEFVSTTAYGVEGRTQRRLPNAQLLIDQAIEKPQQ